MTGTHGIDLSAPGGITALFEHHRRTFGDARMELPEGGTQPPEGGTQPPGTGTQPPGTGTQPPQGGTPPPKKSLEDNLAGLDDSARAFVLGEVQRARTEAKNLRDRLREAEPKVTEYDRLAAASKTELERAQEAASTAAKKTDTWKARAVRSKVEALASAFTDPEDAVAFLEGKLAGYADDAGEIDAETIKTDLADLLARKPHLGKGTRTPLPNPAQGSGGTGAAPAAQLTKADVERLYKAGKHEEIAKARSEGRLDQVMGKTH